MNKLSIFLFFAANLAFGQSTLILPQGATAITAGHILKTNSDVQGYNHTNNTVGVGTYISSSSAFIQTHTPHSLHFTVNNGSAAMTLSYSPTASLSRNLGIGTSTPQEKLHVVGNIRASSLVGTGNRPVYANANGNLVTGALNNVTYVSPFDYTTFYDSDVDFQRDFQEVYGNGANAPFTIRAPLHLPNGVTITGFNIDFIDTNGSTYLLASILKVPRDRSYAYTPIFSASSSSINSSAPVLVNATSNGESALVDNANFYYVFNISVNSGLWTNTMRAGIAVITYTF